MFYTGIHSCHQPKFTFPMVYKKQFHLCLWRARWWLWKGLPIPIPGPIYLALPVLSPLQLDRIPFAGMEKHVMCPLVTVPWPSSQLLSLSPITWPGAWGPQHSQFQRWLKWPRSCKGAQVKWVYGELGRSLWRDMVTLACRGEATNIHLFAQLCQYQFCIESFIYTVTRFSHWMSLLHHLLVRTFFPPLWISMCNIWTLKHLL